MAIIEGGGGEDRRGKKEDGSNRKKRGEFREQQILRRRETQIGIQKNVDRIRIHDSLRPRLPIIKDGRRKKEDGSKR
jgi:hypothetical protein